MARSLLIVGAGYLGLETARRAVAHGFTPVTLGRRHPKPLASTVALAVDVTQPATLAALPESDVLVYAVAADASTGQSYQDAYATGLGHVLRALRGWSRAPHVIFVSSTSVYREDQGGWVREDTGALVNQGPSVAIVEGERLVQTSGLPYTILRFGGIYGPDRLYLARRVKAGEERLFRGPPIYSNRIHRDDGARLILHCADNPQCLGQIFNAVDRDPADRNDVCRWLHQAMGLSTPIWETSDRGQVSARGNKRCSQEKLSQVGFSWEYPTFREGYTALLRALP